MEKQVAIEQTSTGWTCALIKMQGLIRAQTVELVWELQTYNLKEI